MLRYADDVTLLVTTVFSVNIMLSAVCEFGKDFDVEFNPEKTQLLICGDSQRTENSIRDARTPQPGNIVFNTMRYRSNETVQRSGYF